MKIVSNRLFFIDAMRAWAILMMLQGHFIDGLLDPIFRNLDNTIYSVWLYFRGITAPVFFTVSGFIFTYLLLRSPHQGSDNPRIKKGIRRGLQLLLIGYTLRLNVWGLFYGEIYGGFYLVDVLHCIGLSLLVIIGFYQLTLTKRPFWFPLLLIGSTLLLFLFEPIYKQWSFAFLPTGIANYFTKANGSVFTIIPWLGYTTLGAGLSIIFKRFGNFRYLYPTFILFALALGLFLVYLSSPLFVALYKITEWELFALIKLNNYLFIRLGDVFIVFAVFMSIRKYLINNLLLKIGSCTLATYVIHFIILYGSFTGLGLYKFFHHELTPWVAVVGAICFMIICTFLALAYHKREATIKKRVSIYTEQGKTHLISSFDKQIPILKNVLNKLRIRVLRLLASSRI